MVGSQNRLAVTDVTPVRNWYLNRRLNHHISRAQDNSHQAISSQETQIAINFHGNFIVSCPFEASVYSWGTLRDTGSSMHYLKIFAKGPAQKQFFSRVIDLLTQIIHFHVTLALVGIRGDHTAH